MTCLRLEVSLQSLNGFRAPCLCAKSLRLCQTLQLYGPWPTRLLCPWDSPGKNTGVGCHFLLQEIFQTQRLNPGLLHCRQTLYHLSHQMNLFAKQKYRRRRRELTNGHQKEKGQARLTERLGLTCMHYHAWNRLHYHAWNR